MLGTSFIGMTITDKNGCWIFQGFVNPIGSSAMIFLSSGIEKIVNEGTANGEEIFRNIQKLYEEPLIPWTGAVDEYPLGRIESLKDFEMIEIEEEVGDMSIEGVKTSKHYFDQAKAVFSYNFETGVYSKKECYAIDEDGVEARVY